MTVKDHKISKKNKYALLFNKNESADSISLNDDFPQTLQLFFFVYSGVAWSACLLLFAEVKITIFSSKEYFA